jgi:hypothetical protein
MTWEAHITVRGEHVAIEQACARTGAHALSLALLDETGTEACREEMLTLRVPASMMAAESALTALSAELERVGLCILRTKVEAAIGDNTEALYLEHHVKVRIAKNQTDTLREIAERKNAHVSHRARSRTGASEDRYLTARFTATDTQGEVHHLHALLHSLSVAGIPVVKVERERIVIDRVVTAERARSTEGATP